jgi:hypothetical protein
MNEKLKVEAGLKKLCISEAQLISNDIHERTLTYRLASYLEEYFPGYSVDCEYNRNGGDSKRLRETTTFIPSDRLNGDRVIPDIIIHKRGVPPDGDNLIVIEAKKEKADYKSDIKKLSQYKAQLGYKFAFMVIIPENYNQHTDDIGEFVTSI